VARDWAVVVADAIAIAFSASSLEATLRRIQALQ